MASSENQQQTPNPAPPSFSAGDHEMRDYYGAQDAPRPPPQQEPYLTPYLGRDARLSQILINRWTVLLLLVLVRLIFAIGSFNDNIGTARKQALSMCTSVENVGSAMASMPHYSAQGINQMSADGIENAINGLMQMLLMSVTGIEEIVVFVINMFTQQYVCLITAAVGSGLHAGVAVAEAVGTSLNATVQGISKDIGSAESTFQNGMNDFLADVDKLTSALTGKPGNPPTIDLSGEINALNGLQLPSDYDADLQKLNGSIPTFAQVNNFTNMAIRLPFEEVKKLINESLPKYTFNDTMFPVPDKQQLTFCSDNGDVNDFFDALVDIKNTAYKIGLAVLIVAAVLVIIPMAYWEYRRWCSFKERARLVQTHARDPMDSVYIASRPITSTIGLKLARFFKSERRQVLVRWIVAYATTPPVLFVLSLALAGLLGCLCQYALLQAVKKEVPALENQVIGFTDKIINALNNASEQWAVGTNKVITDTNTDINQNVFGWVNTTTHAMNNTLNVFVDGITAVLNETFGGTVLYEPIMDVVNCLVILKMQGFEKGLTWVSDHAHVDFPLMANNTLSLGTVKQVSGSQSDLLNTGPNGGAADAITDAVDHVIHFMESAVRQEAIICTCVLIVWLIYVLGGIGWASFQMAKGGYGCTYVGPQPTSRNVPPPANDDHELDDLTAGRPAPTYEQATRRVSGDNAANKYNGQSYTLQPKPLPTFQVNGESPILQTGFRSPKLGSVNGQNVDSAIRRPTHVRASSHGDYDLTSPQHAPPNPFADPSQPRSIDEKFEGPFADPRR